MEPFHLPRSVNFSSRLFFGECNHQKVRWGSWLRFYSTIAERWWSAQGLSAWRSSRKKHHFLNFTLNPGDKQYFAPASHDDGSVSYEIEFSLYCFTDVSVKVFIVVFAVWLWWQPTGFQGRAEIILQLWEQWEKTFPAILIGVQFQVFGLSMEVSIRLQKNWNCCESAFLRSPKKMRPLADSITADISIIAPRTLGERQMHFRRGLKADGFRSLPTSLASSDDISGSFSITTSQLKSYRAPLPNFMLLLLCVWRHFNDDRAKSHESETEPSNFLGVRNRWIITFCPYWAKESFCIAAPQT